MAEFRVLTFVTKAEVYSDMRSSFEAAGFQEPDAVYETIDNTRGNIADPYSTVNDLLAQMTEPFLVICHQDIRLEAGATMESLRGEIARADHAFPGWAVAGAAGRDMEYRQVSGVTDPWRAPKWPGPWPVEAEVLDEVLLVVRPGRAELSSGLTGFHLYAADLCLSARRTGGHALVIDFPLMHMSDGLAGWRSASYHDARVALQDRLSPLYGFRLFVTVFGDSMILSRHRRLRRLADHNVFRMRAQRWLGRRLVP